MLIYNLCLLEGSVYFTFRFPNAVFIRGWGLREEIRYSQVIGTSTLLVMQHCDKFWLTPLLLDFVL